METQPRHILVTYALPYANGDIHLGHILGFVQTDIWVRFQQMQGHECFYICGSDAHGTPIMISAEQQGVTPETLIDRIHKEHLRDLQAFHINFDNFYTTHSPENRKLSEHIYHQLNARGDLTCRTISQAFDPIKNMFLPDRYVKGECPRCNAKDQYGDACEVCGATYAPTDLINAYSVMSGAAPVIRESEHFFFDLPRYTETLKKWIHNGHLQEQISNKLEEWFTSGLKAWDITRDAPYFGFSIPGFPDKFFYVWLDAPIGYMASFKHFCAQRPDLNFDAYWMNNADEPHKTELYHFIGKDIMYFHALFWPAMLMAAGYRTPNSIFVHGFLTVNGQKMSKSRGTFIKARTYLEQLDPDYLRYYFASRLGSKVEDVDFNVDDFIQRINSDLIGKVVNIASRCAKFINQSFQHQLAASLAEPLLYEQFVQKGQGIAKHYESREYHKAMRDIMELANIANQYIDEHKPWTLAKDPAQHASVQAICSMGLELFRLLITYLKPVLPGLAAKAEQFLNISPLKWSDSQHPLLAHSINDFIPLLTRIDPTKVDFT